MSTTKTRRKTGELTARERLAAAGRAQTREAVAAQARADQLDNYALWWARAYGAVALVADQVQVVLAEVERPDSPLANLLDLAEVRAAVFALLKADSELLKLAPPPPHEQIPDPVSPRGGRS